MLAKFVCAVGVLGTLYETFRTYPGYWLVLFLLVALAGACFVADQWEAEECHASRER